MVFDAGGRPPAAVRSRLMARIIARRYRAIYMARSPQGAQDYALKGSTTSWPTAAPMRCSARPVAARPRCSISSPGCSGRREGRILFDGKDVTDLSTAGAQHRAGVPVSGHLRHHDGLRQSRFPAAQPRRARSRCRPHACARSLEMIDLADLLDRSARGPDRRREAEDLARAAGWSAPTSTPSCSTSR